MGDECMARTQRIMRVYISVSMYISHGDGPCLLCTYALPQQVTMHIISLSVGLGQWGHRIWLARTDRLSKPLKVGKSCRAVIATSSWHDSWVSFESLVCLCVVPWMHIVWLHTWQYLSA